MKKNITETAMYLWKRIELIYSFSLSNFGTSCQEEIKKIFEKYPNMTSIVIDEYVKKGISSSFPVLMVAREFEKNFYKEIEKFLYKKYKDCGAHWSAGGTGCCASASAEAYINQEGEIFAYRLSWSSATGNGNFRVIPENLVASATEALDDFNHFSGESYPQTMWRIIIKEDWEAVASRFLSIQDARKERFNREATTAWRNESFTNGIDVYESTINRTKENAAEKLAARNEAFAEAKAKAMEARLTEIEISQIIKLAGRGQVINHLNLVARMVAENNYETVFILQILNDLQGKKPAVIESYAFLVAHATEIKLSSAKKVAQKAYAWSYLKSLIPGFGVGYFDDAMEALLLALANNVPFKNDTESFGGENSESDLAIRLREAGLAK